MTGIRYSFNSNNRNIEIKRCNNAIHSSKTHFHEEVSIGLIESGSSKTEIEGNIYDLTKNTFLIIPPNISHRCNPENYENWNFKMLYINTEWFKSGFNTNSKDIGFDYMKINEKIFLDVVKLIDDIEKGNSTIENESKLLNYISLLLNNDKLYLDENVSENINSNIRKIKEYVDLNYLEDIRLEDLSNIINISKFYLIKKFNDYYGLSPHQYITNLRINHAKRLLQTNKDFVSVAIESGFYDQSHFIKNFKEYTGVTPMIYKRNI